VTELQAFGFNYQSIRTILDNDGEIWFVAKDVADILGYADPAQAIKQLCKKYTNCTNIPITVVSEIKELHRTKSLVIPESDVYRLIMRSKLESAERFQDWVVEEVLPSIRKSGSYSMPELSRLQLLNMALQAEQERLLLESQINRDRPKVEFAEKIRASEACIDVGVFAKLIGWGRNRLFNKMREDGLLDKRNIPLQRYKEMGVFDVDEIPYKDETGKDRIMAKTKITGKGQVYLEKKYRAQA
jgi:anti-repressor protein